MSLDRRAFLGLSGALSIPFVFGRIPSLLAEEGKTDATDGILVVVQLAGGNDGLSTVVPFADDAYGRARRELRVEKPLRLSDTVGLHPNLDGLHALFQEGKLAIVQGVSYPNPNRSHFQSMDIWQTADLRGRAVDTGWLGRTVDRCCAEAHDPNLVVNIGAALPYALNAEAHKAVTLTQPEAYRWRGRAESQEEFDRVNAGSKGESTADWLHRVAAAARESSSDLRRAAANYRTTVDYPQGSLGTDLRLVASLIHGGLPTRVFYVSLAGFDTHVRQKNTHDALMRQLGDAVAAFHKDLRGHGHGERVLTLAFSEFGRRVVENASAGTDHGVAAPMFLVGERVKGGLHGKHPSLTDLDHGDLRMTTDFRSVYATVIEDWFRAPAQAVLGETFPKLALI